MGQMPLYQAENTTETTPIAGCPVTQTNTPCLPPSNPGSLDTIHQLPSSRQAPLQPVKGVGHSLAAPVRAEEHLQLWQHCTPATTGTACPALLTAPALLDCQQCTACTCYANATSSHCRVVQPRCKALQLLREHSTAEWTAQHHNRSPKGLLQLAAADVQQAVIC